MTFIKAKIVARVHLLGCTALKHSSIEKKRADDGGFNLISLYLA